MIERLNMEQLDAVAEWEESTEWHGDPASRYKPTREPCPAPADERTNDGN